MELMNDQKKAVEKLNDLLEKNYDARKGYTEAMEDIEDPALRNYFMMQAERRSHFANELTNRIKSCGGEPIDSGSTTGDLHRTWMNIKSSMSGDKEEAILEECIRGDKASVEEYQDAIEDQHLNVADKDIIRKEKAEVEQTLGKIKTMEDVRQYYGE
ncbi:MAG TPA: PA2169 family four-helix-bundle protein [Flavobacteriaceae bacterium]|nr:PA2169 family four-helix-bundle protein [Flavobacteriaceae bacterium]